MTTKTEKTLKTQQNNAKVIFNQLSDLQFLRFCNRMDVQKISKGILHFSALVDLPETSKKFDPLKFFCYF